jgi:purine-binding chemotaxis protein CheW
MAAVNRIVQRPELAPLPDSPTHVAGVFDLGGKMIPVLDLSILLNSRIDAPALTDSVIVLEGNGILFGIIASEVKDVISIPAPEPQPKNSSDIGRSGIVESPVRVQDEIVLILNARKLEEFVGPSADNLLLSVTRTSGRELSVQERQALRVRATALASPSDTENNTALPQVVVVGLDGEYFGIPLRSVREFCETRIVTPVPCCPDHISGSMNLRGEILVVMDLRPILREGSQKAAYRKIVVLEEAGICLGLGIDDVYDVVAMDTAKLSRLPLTADTRTVNYFTGTGIWNQHALMILDCYKLLSSPELVVNDEV